MTKAQYDRMDLFRQFVWEHRIETIQYLDGFWQASTKGGSARDKTERLAVVKLARAKKLKGFKSL